MKVIYHANCLDGFTAAWAAWCVYKDEATYIPAQYGEPPPDVTADEVVIVDFSYPRETLIALKESASWLRVLDHHKTAQADLEGLDFCTFDMLRSGAGLAWDEIVQSPRPSIINYVEDRDLWRWALPQSREINAYIGSFEQTFETWSKIRADLNDDRRSCVSQGEAILRGVDRYVREMAKQVRMFRLAGCDVPVVNAPYINTSELVGYLAEQFGPFAVGWFQRGDGKYQYSLRSRGDYDVSEVARQFGGGGHKSAAGFTVDKLVHG